MPIVLDNTKGTSLGMAMVQHSMDNLVKQRMALNTMFHDANMTKGKLMYEQAATLEHQYITAGKPVPTVVTNMKEQGLNVIDTSRFAAAQNNKNVQGSSPEFNIYRDASKEQQKIMDAARPKTDFGGPSVWDRWSNAAGRVTKQVGKFMGSVANGVSNAASAVGDGINDMLDGSPATTTPDPGVSTVAPDVTVAPDPSASIPAQGTPDQNLAPDIIFEGTPLMQNPKDPNRIMFDPLSTLKKGVSK